MATVSVSVPARGEIGAMADQTATATMPIDIKIIPDAPCLLDLAITKPAGAELTIKKKYGATGAVVSQIVSADATTETEIEVVDIQLKEGDELQVNIDATNGDKTVSAQVRRLG